MGKEKRVGAIDYTDVALVSAGVVGSIIIIMRVTDGISDLIVGRMIDKTNTKLGKARPWIVVGSIGVVFATIEGVVGGEHYFDTLTNLSFTE